MRTDQTIEVLNTRMKMAIEERNPTEIEFLYNMLCLYYNQMKEIWSLTTRLNKMEDKVQRGEWKIDEDENGYKYGTCSICGYTEWTNGNFPNYCPNCGDKK